MGIQNEPSHIRHVDQTVVILYHKDGGEHWIAHSFIALGVRECNIHLWLEFKLTMEIFMGGQ